jgi:hypothetical protein
MRHRGVLGGRGLWALPALLAFACIVHTNFGLAADPGVAAKTDAAVTRIRDAAATDASAIDGSALVSAAPSDVDAGDASVTAIAINGCVPRTPAGATPPVVREQFPARGTSGYVAELIVHLEHAAGERPQIPALDSFSDTEALKEIEKAGFRFVSGDAGFSPNLQDGPASAVATRKMSQLHIPLLVLPAKGGRQVLTLPPLPVTLLRANGDRTTICTAPLRILVEDPTAETPEAMPQPNPPGRPQIEPWESLELALKVLGAIAVGALLGALLYRAYRRRPKPVPPPRPERPPWEVALEALSQVEHSGLIANDRRGEFVARVNDAVRMYFGMRYDFDGLESTTAEIERRMAEVLPRGLTGSEISVFLRDCDLVKFANLQPTDDACMRFLIDGIHMVRVTTPNTTAQPRVVHAPIPAQQEGALGVVEPAQALAQVQPGSRLHAYPDAQVTDGKPGTLPSAPFGGPPLYPPPPPPPPPAPPIGVQNQPPEPLLGAELDGVQASTGTLPLTGNMVRKVPKSDGDPS